MGFALAHADCIACGQPFSFNPVRVPSIRVNGVREPVCEPCMTRANVTRAAAGRPLLTILPGAYEPADESEM